MAESEVDTQFIEPIQRYLEERGWEPQSGEGWVDHTFANDRGELHIEYVPSSPNVLSFGFETDTHEAELSVGFDRDPLALLEVIVGIQDRLSEETWPELISGLLPRSPSIYAATGLEEDDVMAITTLDQGVEALWEKEWEYYDEDVHSPDQIIDE